MSFFLDVIPVDDARKIITGIAPTMPTENLPLAQSQNRILAVDTVPATDIPGFSRSVVDGYALLSSDTIGASESMPAMLTLRGRIQMGKEPETAISAGECIYIPTGGMLPDGADAVAMIEYCEVMGEEVLVQRAVAPGENWIFRGEDFSTEGVLIPRGTRLSSRHCGVLAANGVAEVSVSRQPVVGIISTGNELISIDKEPVAAQVRDANTYLCAGFVTDHGGIPRPYGIVRDERGALHDVLETAVAECDIVLVSGGSSKDDRDMCADTIAEMGEVLVHGIAIAPGKPTIIGRAGTVPVIGLPGHPASAYVVLIALVADLLHRATGENAEPLTRTVVLAENVPSARGREDYVRMALEPDGARPIFGKSGLLNTLIRSQALLRVPAEREGYETGDEVEVILW